MFLTAVIIGVYSYTLLLIGLLGVLNFINVLTISIFFFFITLILLNKYFFNFFNFLKSAQRIEVLIITLLLILIGTNFLGALGPELAFDSLWYHLTIPKLFNIQNKVYFIEGNLFYYSLMPKLGEMLFSAALFLGSEILAKIVHFVFGLLSGFALYKLSLIYLTKRFSLLALVIYYSSLVVSWLSITAYSDLIRAFFEILSLVGFIYFSKEFKTKYLVLSGIMLGFSISTKIISFGTLAVFIILILMLKKLKLIEKIKKISTISIIAVLIPLPWFVISYYYTHNPFYPLFTHLGLRNSFVDLINPVFFIKSFINTFLFAPDPINPFYLISIPIIIIFSKKLFSKYNILFVYSVLTYLVWYGTSQSGGTRFLTSYLPAYTVLGILAFTYLKSKFIKTFLVTIVIAVLCITILYRGVANARYVPVILGVQTKEDFLMQNLNFSFGDFYDEKGEIKKLVGSDLVLLHGLHNLYYVDFNYTIYEWKNKKDAKYILIQESGLPEEFGRSKLIYKNPRTMVELYKL